MQRTKFLIEALQYMRRRSSGLILVKLKSIGCMSTTSPTEAMFIVVIIFYMSTSRRMLGLLKQVSAQEGDRVEGMCV